ELQRVNHQGTASLVRAAANLDNPPKVILISSAAAGGPAAAPPRRPEDPPQPVSIYGKSKLAGEIAAIENRGNCPVTIVRPGIVFGEGDQEFIRIFRAITKTRVNPLVGGGLQP